MKRIIALYTALAIAIVVHAEEGAELRPLPPPAAAPQERDAVISQMYQDGRAERDKAIKESEAKRETLGELERLAVPIGTFHGPRREQLLPYRFNDAAMLHVMLRDPEWKNHWNKIAVTIGMVADKKAALDLIEFVKSSELPEGCERDWDCERSWKEARAIAIAALGYTLMDQDIPEVLEFLEKMTDESYVKILNFGHRTRFAQFKAYGALYAAATDETIALLERTLLRKMAEKERQTIQALSVGGYPKKDGDDKASRDIGLLEMYIEDAKRNRAGVGLEPNNDDNDMP